MGLSRRTCAHVSSPGCASSVSRSRTLALASLDPEWKVTGLLCLRDLGASARIWRRTSRAMVGLSQRGMVSTSPRCMSSWDTPDRFTASRLPGDDVSIFWRWLWSPRIRDTLPDGNI